MSRETGEDERPIRVMLVEDEATLRAIAKCVIDGTGAVEVVADLPTGEAAFELYPFVKPDVVLMDIHMPGEGGISAAGRIVARDAAARVVFWSSDTSEEVVRRALDTGAVGFVDKLGPCEDLAQAARLVHQGEVFFSPGVLRSGAKESGGAEQQSSGIRDLHEASRGTKGFTTPRPAAA